MPSPWRRGTALPYDEGVGVRWMRCAFNELLDDNSACSRLKLPSPWRRGTALPCDEEVGVAVDEVFLLNFQYITNLYNPALVTRQ